MLCTQAQLSSAASHPKVEAGTAAVRMAYCQAMYCCEQAASVWPLLLALAQLPLLLFFAVSLASVAFYAVYAPHLFYMQQIPGCL